MNLLEAHPIINGYIAKSIDLSGDLFYAHMNSIFMMIIQLRNNK